MATPTSKSIDYAELTEADFREGMGLTPDETIPEAEGQQDGDDYWDNEFGAFWRRPDGSFYYN